MSLFWKKQVLIIFIFCFCKHQVLLGADPLLLTPGPLTTSESVKKAMLRDLGSRDFEFSTINAKVMKKLVSIVNGSDKYAAVPIQGSGTFAVEAMLRTFVPNNKKVLILINGAYGKRMEQICKLMDKPHLTLKWNENELVNLNNLEEVLINDINNEISHVACIYCETTTGLVNPIHEVGILLEKYEKGFLIDAMSAFGALPLDSQITPFDAVVASANKCLHSVPGFAFCIARKSSLEKCEKNANSLCLDLYAQHKGFEKNGQWRFTPPVQAILALDKALQEWDLQGGITARLEKYKNNLQIILDKMKLMGFELYLDESIQGPIILTFYEPQNSNFCFKKFYTQLKENGYVIYPGKATEENTFRIGCIGELSKEQIYNFLDVVQQVLKNMNL